LPDGDGLRGRRHSIGLACWWHLGIDTLWLANGLVFFVLLFTTGQWMRLGPLHFLVLCWFMMFIVIRIALVVTTGALRNLSHMFAAKDSESWTGFWVFAAAVVVVLIAWVASTPVTYRHPRVVQRVGFARIGPAQRLFEHLDSKPGHYTENDISPYFWHNGNYPDTDEYLQLLAGDFADSKLRINGLVENPAELGLAQLRELAHHEQITQHFCIQGWSGVAKWGGVSLQTGLDTVKPKPEAKWVIFYSFAPGPEGGL
jgi:methionine sulfoxide reductase catalytic subunit